MQILPARLQEGVELITEHERQDNGCGLPEVGSDVAMATDAMQVDSMHLLQDARIARLGTALQVFQQALRGAERLCAVQARPTLLKMLPYLLRIQVCADRFSISLAFYSF